MKSVKQHTALKILSILTLFAAVTTVFVIAFTYAGNAEQPDATASYSMTKIKWDVKTDSEGVAQLNIFGEPKVGEEYPLIHPYSSGDYCFRLKNDGRLSVGYTVYLYMDNPHNVPLEFKIKNTVGLTTPLLTPAALEGMDILSTFGGTLAGGAMRDFSFEWKWVTESDQNDTAIGNIAAGEDLICTVHVMIVIEDNNSYLVGSGGGSSAVLLHRRYVLGYPEGDFRQENNMTRAEVSAIFARIMADYDEDALKDTSSKFPDVLRNDWFAKYVTRLEDNDIIKGYEDGDFRPDNYITRAEFATVCVRFFEKRAGGQIKGDTDGFKDVTAEHWATEYIEKAAIQGFVNGYPDGTFRPDEYITRAEVVTIVNRMLNRYPDQRYIDRNIDKLIEFDDLKDNEYWAFYQIYEAANNHYARVSDKSETWVKTK